MTEPIDQATKDLIEKEADKLPIGKGSLASASHYRKGYIAGATVWAEKLKQERNKVIDECIAKLSSTTQVRRLLESLKTP